MKNLEYKGYYGSIEYDEDYKCLCGKALGMSNDSITYEGNSVQELYDDFKAGIESYLEGCKEMGIKPRKSYNGVLNIRIPSEIHCQVALYAEAHGTSINAVIRESIERKLACV